MSTFRGRDHHNQLPITATISPATSKAQRVRLMAWHPNRTHDGAQARFIGKLKLEGAANIPGIRQRMNLFGRH
jgi:hypothetical protein